MNKETYEKKLQKLKEATEKKRLQIHEVAERKRKRLLKRIELQKNKPKQEKKSTILNRCQKFTNAIVRIIYKGFPCYTCGEPIPQGDEQAGHCWTVKGHPYARFDFDNERLQGSCCNKYRSGYQTMFSYKLQKELGAERWETLFQRAKSSNRYSKEELYQLIEERKKLLEEYKSKLFNL